VRNTHPSFFNSEQSQSTDSISEDINDNDEDIVDLTDDNNNNNGDNNNNDNSNDNNNDTRDNNDVNNNNNTMINENRENNTKNISKIDLNSLPMKEVLKIFTSHVKAIQQQNFQCKVGKEVLEKYTMLVEEDPKLTGQFWSWPAVRQMAQFVPIDPPPELIMPQEVQWNDSTDMQNPDDCEKTEDNTYNNKDITAGCFEGGCLHTVCYGLHMMLTPEGRKDLFKVCYERFPKEVLDELNVIFDFGCQVLLH
jgi:hypothetical protein